LQLSLSLSVLIFQLSDLAGEFLELFFSLLLNLFNLLHQGLSFFQNLFDISTKKRLMAFGELFDLVKGLSVHLLFNLVSKGALIDSVVDEAELVLL
jgi:hypothetical protein